VSAGRPAERAGRRLCGGATSAAAIVVPLIFAAPLASPFSLPKEVVLELAGAVALLGFALQLDAGGRHEGAAVSAARPGEPAPGAAPVRGRRHRLAALTVVPGALLWLAVLALSAAVAWARQPMGAPYALDAGLRWTAFLALACAAQVVGRAASTRLAVLQAVTLSAALVSAIGLCQHIDLFRVPIPIISVPGSTFGNRNIAGEAIAMSLPFGLGALFLARTRGEGALLASAVALECLYLAATRARGAWLGGLAGLLTFALTSRRAWSRQAVAALVALAVAALVVASLPGRANPRYAADSKRLARGMAVIETTLDPSAPARRTRIGLWRRSLAMLATAPLLGVGPGNWAVVFPAFAEPGATRDGVFTPTLEPRHAHDDLLELVTETGLVGLLAMLALAAGVTASTRRQLRDPGASVRIGAAAAAGSLVALLGCGITGFPLEMPATLAIAGLAVGLVAARPLPEPGPVVVSASWPRGSGEARRSWRLGAIVLAVALLGLVLATGTRRLGGSAWLGVAERSVRDDPGPPGAERALEALERARRAGPPSFRVALRTTHAAARLRRSALATAAADRAIALEPFSPWVWAALAGVQLTGGDPASARRSAERALALLHDYPYPLFVLARSAEALGDGAGATSAWASLERLAAEGATADRALARSAQELLAARTLPPGQIPATP
jgi:O-antigen ligase